MKRSFSVACVLALTAVAYADQSVVTGQLTFNSAGVGQIAECGTQRIIEFGVMASTPYFQFAKRYEEISRQRGELYWWRLRVCWFPLLVAG
jgi:hypothetical protein